jgi:hypothetical protein
MAKEYKDILLLILINIHQYFLLKSEFINYDFLFKFEIRYSVLLVVLINFKSL